MTEQERPKRPSQPRAVLCPYCGEVSAHPGRCAACGGRFDPLSRQATQNQMGPWFIRDSQRPFRPGCSYETLRSAVARGQVRPDTIIRGPATHQFWSFAGRTPSIANLMGLCHNCEARVRPEDAACPSCGASFAPDAGRQSMGLSPVILLPGQAPPELIAATSFDSDPGDEAEPEVKPAATAQANHPPLPVAAGSIHRSSAAPAPRTHQATGGSRSRGHRWLVGILLGVLALSGLAALGAWTVWMLKPAPKAVAGSGAPAPRGVPDDSSAPRAVPPEATQPRPEPASPDTDLQSSVDQTGLVLSNEPVDAATWSETEAPPSPARSAWQTTLDRLGDSPLDAAALNQLSKDAQSGGLAPEEAEALRRVSAIVESLSRMRGLP